MNMHFPEQCLEDKLEDYELRKNQQNGCKQ